MIEGSNYSTTGVALLASTIDPILKKYSSSIQDFGYVGDVVSNIVTSTGTSLENLARTKKFGAGIQAINPSSLIDEAIMYDYRDKDSALNPTE